MSSNLSLNLSSQPSAEEAIYALADGAAPDQPWRWRLLAWLHLCLTRLLWLEPFWIAGLMPSLLARELFWDPWLHPWLIGALFIFWPLRLLVQRQLAPYTPLNRPIWGLLLWLPIGIWAAVEPIRAWQHAGFLALGIALYMALLNWSVTQRRPWLLAVAIGGCGLFLTVLGPELLLRVPTKFILFSDEVTRSQPLDLWQSGETVNPNVLAGGLLLPIPLLVALSIRTSWARQRWLPPLLLLIAMPIVMVLILVQSRGSYLALAIALLTVLALRWPWAGVASAIALVTTTLIMVWEGALLFLEAFGSDGSITSFSGRLEIWQATLLALRTHALWGLGFGNFALAVSAYLPGWRAGVPHAHNLLLQVAVDLGLPGLFLYSWLLYQACAVVVGIVRQDGYDVNQPVATPRPVGQPRPWHGSSQQAWRSQIRERAQARRCASLRWALAVGVGGGFLAM
ncbi:MAG TPA: O-antigen ligase family protein, partial [Caldilineaceae bacterium]|nr:O-antigen ligase family protein [Caldilineaceae bacterium]